MRDAFRAARQASPCIMFFDEVDALGGRRSQHSDGWTRGAVNQLLVELDGVDHQNEGLFVLGVTNQPWDIDPALRRPGRRDRTVLVLPPDEVARTAIFAHHLRDRPIEQIACQRSPGAPTVYVGRRHRPRLRAGGRERADGRRSFWRRADDADGRPRGRAGGSSSLHRPWLDSARNVVLFGDDDGTYGELRSYLKKRKRL